LIVGDVLDTDLVLDCSKSMNVIVHLAASTGVRESLDDPLQGARQNVFGTLNALEGARLGGAQRFVFASSGASVGECTPPIHEELPTAPVSPYGASKLAGEGYCSAYFGAFCVETVSLRFGNVFGPGSVHKGSVVAKFIRRAIRGNVLEVYGDGAQTRDFIYIDDLIEAIWLSATVPGIKGEVFQIATGRERSVNELTDALVAALKRAGVGGTTVTHGPSQAGEVLRNFSDTSKANRMLGWEPIVDLDVGLQRTIDWFLDDPART